ncbi:hypothetical protein L1887_52083 [Cichorium endivia]|nr:hypothetical protein L1887_52083 [Cichorium endivia]
MLLLPPPWRRSRAGVVVVVVPESVTRGPRHSGGAPTTAAPVSGAARATRGDAPTPPERRQQQRKKHAPQHNHDSRRAARGTAAAQRWEEAPVSNRASHFSGKASKNRESGGELMTRASSTTPTEKRRVKGHVTGDGRSPPTRVGRAGLVLGRTLVAPYHVLDACFAGRARPVIRTEEDVDVWPFCSGRGRGGRTGTVPSHAMPIGSG